MDLNHISVFVNVVDAGSFTAAGEVLGLPKSSVSRIVSRLEEELGVRLLQRTTRSLHLTETGRSYYERARLALAGLGEAHALAANEGPALRGTVRMTAPLDIGMMALAELLAHFGESYPDIHVELVLTNRYVDLVEEGIDLAIRAGVLEDSSLIARKVGTSDFGLYAAPSYLARRGTPTDLTALRDHACVLFGGRDGRAVWTLTDEEGRTSAIDVRGTLSVDDLLFAMKAMEAGAGIGMLPLTSIPMCASRGHASSLVRVFPNHTIRGGSLYVVTPSLELSPRRVTLLRDFLVTELSRMHAER